MNNPGTFARRASGALIPMLLILVWSALVLVPVSNGQGKEKDSARALELMRAGMRANPDWWGQDAGAPRKRVELPDTPIGKIMREWFGVIDSGDAEEINHFVATRFSANAFRFQRSAADYVAFFRKLHEQSGGLEIVQVRPDVAGRPFSVLARSKRGDHYALVQAGLDRTEREKLFGLGIDKAESPGAPKLSDISEKLSELR